MTDSLEDRVTRLEEAVGELHGLFMDLQDRLYFVMGIVRVTGERRHRLAPQVVERVTRSLNEMYDDFRARTTEPVQRAAEALGAREEGCHDGSSLLVDPATDRHD